MEQIKKLNLYQKGILILLIAMTVAFGVIYAIVTSRVGLLYQNVILKPTQENGGTVYSGKVEGRECRITITEDRTVTVLLGEDCYGPYTAREDPTARPEEEAYLTGVEIRERDEIFFRGGAFKSGDNLMLFKEDGGILLDVTVVASGGTMTDADGNVIDPMAPSPITILELMSGPELTHRGNWGAWFAGILISVLTAASILYADELFRLNLVFRVRDVDMIEPSDWEIMGRYISWIMMTVAAFAVYMVGLQ